MNYLAVGLVIIIVIIIYYIYYYMTNNTLTSGLQELNKPLTITYDKLINPNSLTYSYQAWIYLSSPTTTSTKIFYRGSSDSSNSEFEVDISGQILTLQAGNGSTTPTQIMTIATNYPIQKWTYLVVNVSNLSTFEAYVNGKLAKTVNVSSGSSLIPSSKTSSLYIGNTALNGGYVTKFTRLPKVLDAKTIWETYLSGNGLSSFLATLMPYGLNMSISNGEDVVRVVNMW
jgi:hypothetical protein